MKRISLLLLSLLTFAVARPSLEFDRDRIESGSNFELRLVVPTRELQEPREVPSLAMKDGFSLLGIDSVDARGGDFFSGPYKVRKYVFKIKAPKKTGRFSVGPLHWNIDGQNYELAPSISIELQKAYSDEALSVSLTPSKKSIYEGEQFSVTLGFHTYEHFEGNLQATDMSTGNDFIVYRGDLSSMEFKPVPNTRREMQASGKFAWLAPTKSGNLQIPPFKFKYTKRGEPKVVEENKSHGGFSMHFQSIKQESVEAEATTPTININVKPLPTEGKPADFSGMVGDYKFSADFDRTNLKVGEALTLAINIKGDGTPGTITDPKLPDFSDFRTVPPENNISKKASGGKVVTTKDIKVFLYPKKKGSFQIPEISYSWFNSAKKKYETATAGPWTIEVEKGEASAEAIFQTPVAASNGPAAVQKQEIESLGSDIRYIHSVKGISDSATPYKSVLYWIFFALAIPFYFISSFIISQRRKHNSNAALVRKGKANKQLKVRFANANEALVKGDVKGFYAALENGFIDYLSDLTNLEFKGMTRSQLKQELENRKVTAESITAIDSILDKCALARFAPVSPSAEEQKQMLESVEKICESLGDLK